MTLYDTFSVNIPIKKFPKENESRSAGMAASLRKSKESSILASREASCSSVHIDNIPTERQRCDKLFHSLKNEKCLINDKSTYVTRGQDDVKENLDPIKSRMLSRSGTLDDVNSTSNVDDTVTMSFYGENETVSSDTDNLSTLSQPICNTNIMDMECCGITRVANSCNQNVQVNLEDLQRKDCVRNATSVSVEERPGARLFCKETNRLIHNVDFDLNVVNTNKNVEKVSQNDIIVPTSQHSKDDRIDNDHTDDSSPSWNGYKAVDSTNIIKSKVNNRNIARGVSNITRFNEHNILNKQIDTCGSRKFIRCIAFQDNTVRYNGDTREKSNDFCLKVSIDLCKIQNLIDSKPELFENRERDVNNQRLKHMNRISNLDAYAQQQVKYCDIEINNSCLPKSRELQKSNYMYNVEHMQREIYPSANTFLCFQKSNQRIRDFHKDILDR